MWWVMVVWRYLRNRRALYSTRVKVLQAWQLLARALRYGSVRLAKSLMDPTILSTFNPSRFFLFLTPSQCLQTSLNVFDPEICPLICIFSILRSQATSSSNYSTEKGLPGWTAINLLIKSLGRQHDGQADAVCSIYGRLRSRRHILTETFLSQYCYRE